MLITGVVAKIIIFLFGRSQVPVDRSIFAGGRKCNRHADTSLVFRRRMNMLNGLLTH